MNNETESVTVVETLLPGTKLEGVVDTVTDGYFWWT